MKPPQNKGYDWQSGLMIGGEMKKAAIEKSRKLSPLAGSFEWSGTILPGTLGPNPPEARMSGWTKGVWGNDGLYLHIQGDYQVTVDEMSGSFWKLDFQDDMRIERQRNTILFRRTCDWTHLDAVTNTFETIPDQEDWKNVADLIRHRTEVIEMCK